MALEEWLSQSDDVMSGQLVFRGTRVPVCVLFDNLRDGLPLDEILSSYPTIPRAAAEAVLEYALQCVQDGAEGGL
ncbi:MAG: DUF433 domain-containing protein [Alphaproteobacteria bacterium]|nr:DUF433 domain-containing protein [Alphaproteobacteria bacterium]